MADKSNVTEGNVSGKYYVDQNCISCGVCEATAPDFFSMGEEFAYVTKQPQEKVEVQQCEDALTDCPVNAIGNDRE